VTALDALAQPPERLVELEAVHNFRDLGGYPTIDGRRLRWRRLFRADGLNRLTAADVEVIRTLGLRTVIDLRTSTEIDTRGRFPVDGHPMTFHHLPVIDSTWNQNDRSMFTELDTSDTAAVLVKAYTHMLEGGGPRLAEGLRLLAEPGALPAVFHCAAGKDRTGLLAALLLSGLGVADDDVVADYAMSSEAVERTRQWAAVNSPELVDWLNAVPPIFHAAHPDAMRAILASIHAEHGGARGFAASHGVGPDVWSRLEAELL
jgi:protein-tyrosine phosphatase